MKTDKVMSKESAENTQMLPHEELQLLLKALQAETVPMNGHQDPKAINDCWLYAHELVEEMLNEGSKLAASTCEYAYGDEWGNKRCSEIDKNTKELNSLREQLAKERELRKELVECIEDLKVLESSMDIRKEIESLIQKAVQEPRKDEKK